MKLRRISMACALLITGAGSCFAQQQGAATPSPATQQQGAGASPATTATSIPSYPDTPKGLEDLIKEMLRLKKSNDSKALDSYIQSLVLPNPEPWFRDTLGDDLGAQIAHSYDRTRRNLLLSFSDTLNQLNRKHFGHPDAKLFTTSCNGDPTEDEYTVLASRTREQPLYDVRLTSGLQRVVMSFFVYADGSFRYVGSFRLQTNRIVKRDMKTMVSKAIKTVFPVYPEDAKRRHIQGTVLLHAIIAPDGSICSLEVKEGNLVLAGSALSAVRQWRYSPYTVDDKPVAVDTTITVIFNWGSGN